MTNLSLRVVSDHDEWQSIEYLSKRDVKQIPLLKEFCLNVELGILISQPTPTLPKIRYVPPRGLKIICSFGVFLLLLKLRLSIELRDLSHHYIIHIADGPDSFFKWSLFRFGLLGIMWITRSIVP